MLITLAEAERRLVAGLAGQLPGRAAQARLAPRPRPGWDDPPPASRRAAVLLLVYERPDGPRVLLTVRAGDLPHHGGQVSLPGGVVEPGETFAEAALREAHEEVALDPALVTILGRLTPLYIPVSGFTLHPLVGIARPSPALRPADAEVARILEASLAHLLDPTRLKTLRRTRDGVEFDVPCFEVEGEHVWGATAMVLAEFLDIIANEH